MKIEKSGYAGWNNYPVYRVRNFQDWQELTRWMRGNGVEHFLVSSGYGGYIFQVKHNHEWFILRWS